MVTKINKRIAVILLSLLLLANGQALCWANDLVKTKDDTILYTVRSGDTLFKIAKQYDISLNSLVKTNKLNSTLIYPNEVLVIPGQTDDVQAVLSRGFSREDLHMLAKAIHAEARGESFTGQVAVGAVILNRLKSPDFPKTIEAVIMQKNNNVYQFTPVADGTIHLEPDESSIKAAVQAMKGWDPTSGALFFYNPKIATDKWIRTLPVEAKIGNHVFAGRV